LAQNFLSKKLYKKIYFKLADIQDKIVIPFCLTIDFQALKDNTLTIRNKDTTKQERIKIEEVKDYLKEKLKF
jgi:glycyl-tRNA synthetase